MVPHPQFISTGLHPVTASNIETFLVLFEIPEHRERWWSHDRCIAMTTVIKLLVQICRHIFVVRRKKRIVSPNRNSKIFRARLESNKTGKRVGMNWKADIGWLKHVSGTTARPPVLLATESDSPEILCPPIALTRQISSHSAYESNGKPTKRRIYPRI